jgi:hypothetical protein
LPKIVLVVAALICSITSLYPALPSSNATAQQPTTTSSDTGASSSSLDNVTSLNQSLPALVNQSLPALVNQSLPALVNQTLTSLNETASEQARLTQEARVNITQTLTSLNETASEQARLTQESRRNTSIAIQQQTQTVERAFKDLPFSIYAMFMTAIVAVIALPVALDLHYGRNRTSSGRREERYDLYRALMTFGVIIVVGIVVVYLVALINFNIVTANENVNALIDVLKNLSTIIGTALAAIVAFYFGTRSAQRRGGEEEGAGGGGGGGGAPAESLHEQK